MSNDYSDLLKPGVDASSVTSTIFQKAVLWQNEDQTSRSDTIRDILLGLKEMDKASVGKIVEHFSFFGLSLLNQELEAWKQQEDGLDDASAVVLNAVREELGL